MNATRLPAALAFLALACTAAPVPALAGTKGTDAAIRLLQDRAELKALVDEFAILADRKDVHAQVQLFTPDATLESFINGQPAGTLEGRERMEQAFGAYLATFRTVYHFNGQQAVTVSGDTATGTSYCTVTLVAAQEGRETRTTMGVRYEDQYVRQHGRWLIAHRKSMFDWQDQQEVHH